MLMVSVRRLTFGLAAAVTTLACLPALAQEALMLVTHRVEDFDHWKQVFDQALPTRRAVGEMSSYILHNPVDPSLVTVWFEWETMEQAQAWASDPMLANGMRAAGVVSEPVISFLDMRAMK